MAVLIVLQVAFGGIGPPLRWAYLRLPVVSDLKRLENQINDKKTGLPALSENERKSRLQLEYVMSFLAGKFPEFSSQALKDAQSAAQKGDIPNAVQLLKTATTAVRNLKAQKMEAPASFFSNAIDILSKIGARPQPQRVRGQKCMTRGKRWSITSPPWSGIRCHFLMVGHQQSTY